MGYILRVRLASFFTGAATASFLGLYILHRDYKIAHESISQRDFYVHDTGGYEFDRQIKGIHGSLDSRISALEKINRDEASQHVQATE